MKVDTALEYLTAIIAAMCGGLTRALNKKDKRQLQVWRILIEIFASGFVGWMFLYACQIAKLEGPYIGLVCGISGWLGPQVLGFLWNKVAKILNIEIQEG